MRRSSAIACAMTCLTMLGCVHEGARSGSYQDQAARCSRGENAACEHVCALGDPKACTTLADLLFAHGSSKSDALSKDDLERADTLYARACTAGEATACDRRTMTLSTLAGLACKNGSFEDCVAFDSAVTSGCIDTQTTPNGCNAMTRVGAAIVQRTCVEGSVAECRRACTEHVRSACFVLGSMELSGDRVPRNVPHALELFAGACDEHDGNACAILGALYKPHCVPSASCVTIGTRPVPEDATKAADFDRRGCSYGSAGACEAFVELAERGFYAVAKTELVAIERKLCKQGQKSYCGRLRDLGETP